MNSNLTVKVHPNASQNKVVKSDLPDIDYDVYVTKVPEKGKANDQVIKVLAKELNLKKSQVLIMRGEKSRVKSVTIVK